MTRPVRVALDATAIPANRAGVGRYVDELVAALPATGTEVTVFAQRHDAVHFAGRARAVITAPRWARRPPARLMWEQLGLPRRLRHLDVDVVHCPHYTLPLLTAAGRRVPMVVTVHDATFFTHPHVHEPAKVRFFSWWTKRSVRLADAIVVPSAATRDEVMRQTQVEPEKIWVVPHGVDHNRFRVPAAAEIEAARQWAGVPAGTEYVAFLGTLEPRKNVPALVAAFTEACRGRPDPPQLVLAGGKGWDSRLDDAIAAVPEPLVVARPGFLPDELVAGFLGGAVVVAYPSLGEGFGLPVLEAMACGAPVLTTRLLSLPEVGGDAVAYADSADAGDVATALAALLDDGSHRAHLATAGPLRARGFDWAHAAAAHREVYARLAAYDDEPCEGDPL